MVIPGNLPSQLRVLDSSQQLYTSLFLASYCSSTHTLSLKTLKKTPPPYTMLSPLLSLPFSVSRICLPPHDLCCNHLFSATFLQLQKARLIPYGH